METLCPYENDIPLARVDRGEGPHVLFFLFMPSSLSYDPNGMEKFWGLKTAFFTEIRCNFAEFQGMAKPSTVISSFSMKLPKLPEPFTKI